MSKCYVGRCRCGSIVAATLEQGHTEEELSREIGQWYLDSLSIETVDSEQVRVQFSECCCVEVSRASQPCLPTPVAGDVATAGFRPIFDGSFGDFDFSDVTEEPPRA